MKSNFILLFLFFIPGLLFAQKENENTLSVKINSEEFQAQVRKVKLGPYIYYTANMSKPETMLRIWLGDFYGKQTSESGTYLVVNSKNPPSKKEVKSEKLTEKYTGIAILRYVLETKAPRMTYLVGDSDNNNETLTVTSTEDGSLEISFDVMLNGTHWKEKNAATVVGGLGRIQNKLESKAISKATGYDWNIDPEGNGYRKLKETEIIHLSEGNMIIKSKP